MFTDLMRGCVLLLLALTLAPRPAEAQYRFGEDDNIHRIQDVKLKGKDDEELFLGYMTKTYNFLGGIYVEDAGYVLGVKGQDKRYYRMPTGDELVKFQEAGTLPDPLPPYRLGFFDYLLGYSLWLMLLVVALFVFGGKLFKKKPPDANPPSQPA